MLLAGEPKLRTSMNRGSLKVGRGPSCHHHASSRSRLYGESLIRGSERAQRRLTRPPSSTPGVLEQRQRGRARVLGGRGPRFRSFCDRRPRGLCVTGRQINTTAVTACLHVSQAYMYHKLTTVAWLTRSWCDQHDLCQLSIMQPPMNTCAGMQLSSFDIYVDAAIIIQAIYTSATS